MHVCDCHWCQWCYRGSDCEVKHNELWQYILNDCCSIRKPNRPCILCETVFVSATSRNLSLEQESATIYPSFRNLDKCNVAFRRFNSAVKPIVIDMNDIESSAETIKAIVRGSKPGGEVILINNAGVCRTENTAEALMDSLTVNCLSPVHLSELLVSEHSTLDMMELGNRLVVINVSSGDGELLFLHSEIASKIMAISNFEVRRLYDKIYDDM